VTVVIACVSCGVDIASLPLEQRAPYGIRCAGCVGREPPDPSIVHPPVDPTTRLQVVPPKEERGWGS